MSPRQSPHQKNPVEINSLGFCVTLSPRRRPHLFQFEKCPIIKGFRYASLPLDPGTVRELPRLMGGKYGEFVPGPFTAYIPTMSVQRDIDWMEPLVRPIKVKGRRSAIRTRKQAAEYILDLPLSRQHRRNWIAAATALNSGAAIDIVQRLMVKAISSDGDLG